MTQVQRVDDNESIPTEVPRIERGPPEFSAEEFDTDLLIDEYYTTEDRILRMWAIALQSFQVLANSPAGEVSNAHLHKAVLEFAVGEVLGKLSKPAKVMKDLLDDAANEAAKARNVELEQSISNFFVKHLTAINALRDELNDKNRWKQHIRNLKRTAFGGEDVRPTRGEIWVFGGEGADETRKAFEEYWTLRTEFEELYVDANRRAQRASYFRFYQFLAENWLQHNRTVVWPGVERKAQLFIHVERDFTVREAVLRAPRGKQLAKGFEGLLEAVEEHEGSVISGVDVWDMRIRRRIRYYGRDPDEPYAHLPSHVIVIRRTGVVSEGESWGQDWESILERLRRDRPRIETLTGINE